MERSGDVYESTLLFIHTPTPTSFRHLFILDINLKKASATLKISLFKLIVLAYWNVLVDEVFSLLLLLLRSFANEKANTVF